MGFEIEAAGAHEVQRLGDAVGELLVAAGLRGVLEEAEHPLMHAGKISVAAGRKRTQQVQRRRRLPVGHQLALRIGDTRAFRERDVVDDVAAVARQLLAVDLLGRRRTRLGKLAGDAADLHHRQRASVGQDDRHLQEDAEEVADVVGAVLGEALGTVAALQQEGLAFGDARQRFLQVARLAREHQRRKGRKLRLDIGQCPDVGVVWHLQHRLAAPAVGRPPLGHDR